LAVRRTGCCRGGRRITAERDDYGDALVIVEEASLGNEGLAADLGA
jgi:hypothetical protein